MSRRARIEHLVVVALSRIGLKGLLLAAPSGYLHGSGWIRSARARRPVDTLGRSQPWLTMPAVAFLDGRLSVDLSLFEYGSGGSTAWYGLRVGQVTSVEHDRHWYERVKPELPSNVTLLLKAESHQGTFLELVFRPLGLPTEYAKAIDSAELDRFPDVVVIDGVDRLNCINVVAERAPASTVIIVDNLEYQAELAPAIALLEGRGYRRLDFWGVAPGELRLSDTAVFYQSDNCLGI